MLQSVTVTRSRTSTILMDHWPGRKFSPQSTWSAVSIKFRSAKMTSIKRPSSPLSVFLSSYGFPLVSRMLRRLFPRLIDGILANIDYVFVYLDDILVASETEEEHAEHIRTVLGLLHRNGVTVNFNPIGPDVYFERLRPGGGGPFCPTHFTIRIKGFHTWLSKRSLVQRYNARPIICQPGFESRASL